MGLFLIVTLLAIAGAVFHRKREAAKPMRAYLRQLRGLNVDALLAFHKNLHGAAVMAVDDLITRADAEQLMPEEVTRDIIRQLPQASIAMSKFRRVPMSRKVSRQPVLSALAQAYFVNGDTGLKQTTKEAWTGKELVAEEIAAIVPVPQAVLDDVDYDLWEEIKPDLIEAAGQLVDLAVLFGIGRPSTWAEGIVPAAALAGNEVVRGAVAGQRLDLDVIDTMRLVAADGHPVTGFAADSLMEFDLLGLRDDQGRPIFTTSLQDGAQNRGLYARPFTYLNNGGWLPAEADLIAGDWSQAVLGVRQDITFSVHTEGVISDAAGNVVLNLMQQNSAALKMNLRLAFQVANPTSRRASLVPDADRYPFSVLRPAGYVPAP